MEAVGQFESIVNDSGLVGLERLTTERFRTENEPGIIVMPVTSGSASHTFRPMTRRGKGMHGTGA